jgi:hypothetical protein
MRNVTPRNAQNAFADNKIFIFCASQHRSRWCTKWHKKKRKAETSAERAVNSRFGVFRTLKNARSIFQVSNFLRHEQNAVFSELCL